jgi:hypothetical protein
MWPFDPPPQNYTITQAADDASAVKQAQAWVAADPANRSFCHVKDTGSMKAKFGNSVALLTKSDGSDIAKGDLVYYTGNPRFPAGTNSIHEVAEMNKTHFIANGVSNRTYDGWSPRAGVKFKASTVIPLVQATVPTQAQPAP